MYWNEKGEWYRFIITSNGVLQYLHQLLAKVTDDSQFVSTNMTEMYVQTSLMKKHRTVFSNIRFATEFFHYLIVFWIFFHNLPNFLGKTGQHYFISFYQSVQGWKEFWPSLAAATCITTATYSEYEVKNGLDVIYENTDFKFLLSMYWFKCFQWICFYGIWMVPIYLFFSCFHSCGASSTFVWIAFSSKTEVKIFPLFSLLLLPQFWLQNCEKF